MTRVAIVTGGTRGIGADAFHAPSIRPGFRHRIVLWYHGSGGANC